MTIDESIQRYTDNAEYERTHGNLQGCLDFRQLAEWLRELKQLREQKPCEDAISRQAVDGYITNLLSGYLYDEERTRLEDLTAYIWELPSVTVTPKAESEDKE